MFSSEDIATRSDFTAIINKILSLTSTLIELGYNIETTPYFDWFEYNYLVYDGVKWIEDRIESMGNGFFKPYGWQEYRTWTFGSGFSYKDINRWTNNLQLIEKAIEDNPDVTVWNGQSFANWDTYDTGLEWEE